MPTKKTTKSKTVHELSTLELVKLTLKRLLPGLFAIVIVVGGVVYYSATRADATDFYFSSCLGEWQNAANAQRAPDLSKEAELTEFNEHNSAVLKSGMGSVFCGGVEGNIPENTKIKYARLKFSLGIRNPAPIVEINEEVLTEEGALSSEVQAEILDDDGEVLGDDATKEEESIGEESQEEEDTKNQEEIAEDPMPPTQEVEQVEEVVEENEEVIEEAEEVVAEEIVEETPTQEPIVEEVVTEEPVAEELPPVEEVREVQEQQTEEISFWKKVFGVAHAQTEQETSSEEDVAGEEESEQEQKEDFEENTDEDTEEVIVGPVSTEDHDFIEILYSIDGESWVSLGFLNRHNWPGVYFDIPVITWDELQNLQISVQSFKEIDNQPEVYLDSLWLEANYEVVIQQSGRVERGGRAENNRNVVQTESDRRERESREREIFDNDEESTHQCEIVPFAKEIKLGQKARLEVKRSTENPDAQFRLTTGKFPGGVSAEIIRTSFFSTKDLLEITVGKSAQTGSYNSVISYEEQNQSGQYNSSVCQVNIIISEN